LKGLYEESHKPFVMEIGVYKKWMTNILNYMQKKMICH
jgi:hypothetical protein